MNEEIVFESVERRDRGMVQRSEELRFALESSEALSVPDKGLRQDLDRDFPAELRVAGAINFSHAARAKGRHNFVDT